MSTIHLNLMQKWTFCELQLEVARFVYIRPSRVLDPALQMSKSEKSRQIYKHEMETENH